MITLAPTTDWALIDAALHHPRVLPWILRDDTPDVSARELAAAGAEFLAVTLDGLPGGVFGLSRLGAGIRLHACLVPPCRGAPALEAGRAALRVALAKPGCRVVVAAVPASHRHVKFFLARIGLRPFQTLPDAWPFQGRLLPVTLYRTPHTLCL